MWIYYWLLTSLKERNCSYKLVLTLNKSVCLSLLSSFHLYLMMIRDQNNSVRPNIKFTPMMNQYVFTRSIYQIKKVFCVREIICSGRRVLCWISSCPGSPARLFTRFQSKNHPHPFLIQLDKFLSRPYIPYS